MVLGCGSPGMGLVVVPDVVDPFGVTAGDPEPLPERSGKVPELGPNGVAGAAVVPVTGAGEIFGKTPGVSWNGFAGAVLVAAPEDGVGDVEDGASGEPPA